jgi:DNA polymerase III epsilon subunit-like protein
MPDIIKEFICDTETTGLTSECHIIQFSAIYLENNIRKDEINIYMKPGENAAIYREALRATHTTYKDLFTNKKRISQFEGYNKVIDFLDDKVNRYKKEDKVLFIAYNAKFDEDRIREWFVRMDNQYFNAYFHWPVLSVDQLLAWFTLDTRDKLDNFKLITVAKGLGINIEEEKLHDSEYDCFITEQIYRILCEERDK